MLSTEIVIRCATLLEASRTPSRHDQNRTSPWHIIVKIIITENKERMLKAVREKNQITYKGKITKIIADF
jgi:hypothetical protein